MGTFFKGKSDFVNQSLTKRWTDLIKNSNFISAITGVSNSKHFMPVLNEYPVQDKNKAGQMFIYRGRIWHYMTKDQINDAGWSDIVTEGFPAPLDKVSDSFVTLKNFFSYSTNAFSQSYPDFNNFNSYSEVELDFLGFGRPELLHEVIFGRVYFPNGSTIVKIRNAKFLVNLADQQLYSSLHLGESDYTVEAINELVNELPSTNNTATINLYNVSAVTTEHINTLTNKGYIVIT